MDKKQRRTENYSLVEFSINELLKEHKTQFAVIVTKSTIGNEQGNTQRMTGTYSGSKMEK